MNNLKMDWTSIENTISKDVVRTDRGNPFYAGDDNPNMEVMKSVGFTVFKPKKIGPAISIL